MKRIIIIYGVVAGTIVICNAVLGLVLTDGESSMQFLEWLGYLVMLVALSVIFVGVKRHRDQELGGVITFGTALLTGLGIAIVASVIYVAGWEVYLAATDHAFIDDYTQSIIAAKQAAGVGATELQETLVKMEKIRVQYANPLYRLPSTFMEIFPVGLLIALLSAAVLRNSNVLPAQ